jgi:hypothetical protein
MFSFPPRSVGCDCACVFGGGSLRLAIIQSPPVVLVSSSGDRCHPVTPSHVQSRLVATGSICYILYATLAKYIILYYDEVSILIDACVMHICIQAEHVINFNNTYLQLHVCIHIWFVRSARYLVLLPILSIF